MWTLEHFTASFSTFPRRSFLSLSSPTSPRIGGGHSPGEIKAVIERGKRLNELRKA
jgi:hypothetical protein